jgi:hypothetical protein
VFECIATGHVAQSDGEGEYFAEIPVSSHTQPSFDYICPNIEVRLRFKILWRTDTNNPISTFQYFVALVGPAGKSESRQKLTIITFQRIEIRCLNDSTTRCPPRSIIPSEGKVPEIPIVEGWVKMDGKSWSGSMMNEFSIYTPL